MLLKSRDFPLLFRPRWGISLIPSRDKLGDYTRFRIAKEAHAHVWAPLINIGARRFLYRSCH